jgi:hypothetical protein
MSQHPDKVLHHVIEPKTQENVAFVSYLSLLAFQHFIKRSDRPGFRETQSKRQTRKIIPNFQLLQILRVVFQGKGNRHLHRLCSHCYLRCCQCSYHHDVVINAYLLLFQLVSDHCHI